jgi:type VI secretion system protein ImpG
MPLNPFYEDELSYLRELGRDFAQANPKLAPFLGRDATDPDVERLLEGFAFLVARLRQKLDDEFPEFVHGLLRLVWPQYLQPLPPITTLAFGLAPSASAASLNVPAGTTVRSRPVDGTNCLFATCYPVDVLPLEVTDVQLENRTTSARLSLTIKATGQQNLSCLQKGRLRLFFSTEREPQVGRGLLAWLSRHVAQATVTVADRQVVTLGPEHVKPVGLGDDEAVLPWPRNGFSGFRVIQEYLSYPAKFLYVDVSGLEPLGAVTKTECKLHFDFRRPFPDQLRVAEGQVRLNCTPAINVFSHEASPVRVERTKTEYRVLPSGGPHYSIRSIDRVTGYVQGRPERIEFEPFELLRHDLPGDERNRAFFRQRIRPAIVGRGGLPATDLLERSHCGPAPGRLHRSGDVRHAALGDVLQHHGRRAGGAAAGQRRSAAAVDGQSGAQLRRRDQHRYVAHGHRQLRLPRGLRRPGAPPARTAARRPRSLHRA